MHRYGTEDSQGQFAAGWEVNGMELWKTRSLGSWVADIFIEIKGSLNPIDKGTYWSITLEE